MTEISLPALLFNSADLQLLVTSASDAQPGGYPITVTAQSLNRPDVAGTAETVAEVGQRGVTVAISPASGLVDPAAPAVWDVTVANAGSLADTFDLTVSGAPALNGTLSAASVSLAPGATQTVQLTAADLAFLLPGSQTFAVMAQSQADSRIQAQDAAAFTVAGSEAVAVAWQPPSQTVTDVLTAQFTLAITNTGNLITLFTVDAQVAGAASVPAVDQVLLPPGSMAVVPVTVQAPGSGVYTLSGTAASPGGVSASADATLTMTYDAPTTPAAPVLSIAREGADVVLSWPPVTADIDGNPLTISHYEVWRSLSPYCVPGDAACSVPLVAEQPASPFVDAGAALDGAPYFYQVRAVSAADVVSAPSNRVGKFSFTLQPGGD